MQYDILVKVIFIVINTHNFTFRKQTYFLQASSKVYYDGATLKLSQFFTLHIIPYLKMNMFWKVGPFLPSSDEANCYRLASGIC